tara:strand:+ start:1279 stop:2517 length:1239 start_codon:yes stop_codon:yes gene_type:complete
MKKKEEEILIIGGSMAGLLAGMSLKNRGYEVKIFERSTSSLENRGAGIATHDELYEALEFAGLSSKASMGVVSDQRLFFSKNGDVTHRVAMPQTMTSWGLIYRFLKLKLSPGEYYPDHCLNNILYSPDGKIIAKFTNGKTVQGDFLVGADGSLSRVRQILLPHIKPEHSGYIAWRGLVNESDIPSSALHKLANKFSFALTEGGHWLGYLVAGPNDDLAEGKRWYNWVWYQWEDTHSLEKILTDKSGKYYPSGIPPNLITEKSKNYMRKKAAQLPSIIRELVTKTKVPFLQGIQDLCVNRLSFDKVVLIGDAACTARPHVGLGVSKAASDAMTLTKALLSPDREEALERWQQSRLEFAKAVFQWSRDLGSYIGSQKKDKPTGFKADYYDDPNTLIIQNASNQPSHYIKYYLAR